MNAIPPAFHKRREGIETAKPTYLPKLFFLKAKFLKKIREDNNIKNYSENYPIVIYPEGLSYAIPKKMAILRLIVKRQMKQLI